MFDFLFKATEDDENVIKLSQKVESLTEEVDTFREDLEKIKVSLADLQMSLALVLSATQGIADDLSVLYTTVFGSEHKKNSMLSFSIEEIDDEDYEN